MLFFFGEVCVLPVLTFNQQRVAVIVAVSFHRILARASSAVVLLRLLFNPSFASFHNFFIFAARPVFDVPAALSYNLAHRIRGALFSFLRDLRRIALQHVGLDARHLDSALVVAPVYLVNALVRHE